MPRTEMDAVELLEQDHREVEALLQQYESAGDPSTKEDLAEEICEALTVHASIEEEIFYPAVAEKVEGAEDLVEEARKEHASVKQLINDIESTDAEGSELDSLLQELGANVKHHVEEEEQEMFPKVRDSDLDLQALGQRMSARKNELMGEQSPA
ncbi:MAG: hypothetical protein QOK29_1978 [Rhodospirillaceae bacterium]|jgi:hemerythrin superfamily protein|nr:hypothetical protein [Rhodospirillaceae bacterium]